jgi:hypothetical protein
VIKGIKPALAEGGKIKIGGLGAERKATGGGTYRLPQKIDHFQITKNTRDVMGDLEIDKELMAALPQDADGKIRAIPIILHSDEIDEVFPTVYAMYAGKRLLCSGDGEKAVRFEVKNNERTGVFKEMGCPCDFLNATGKLTCKPHGTLHCSIAAPGHAVAGAVHKWRTTSVVSIGRMLGSILAIKNAIGTLAGLPLWLKLEAIKVSPNGQPTSTVYVCHLELRAADIASAQAQALEQRRIRQSLGGEDKAAYRALIHRPAGPQETEAEIAELELEFYHQGEEPPATRAQAAKMAIAKLSDGNAAPEDEEEVEAICLLLSKAAIEGRAAFDAQYEALTKEERRKISPDQLEELQRKIQ